MSIVGSIEYDDLGIVHAIQPADRYNFYLMICIEAYFLQRGLEGPDIPTQEHEIGLLVTFLPDSLTSIRLMYLENSEGGH